MVLGWVCGLLELVDGGTWVGVQMACKGESQQLHLRLRGGSHFATLCPAVPRAQSAFLPGDDQMTKPHPVQTLQNHAKIVPGYHYVATFFSLVFTVWAVLQLFREPNMASAAFFSLAIAVNLIGFYTRGFANQNQDRIIRLEERLRFRELLPTDLHGRIGDFTTSQLVGLRFASDEELPELARRVLEEGIGERKAIKALIQNWRGDYHRV